MDIHGPGRSGWRLGLGALLLSLAACGGDGSAVPAAAASASAVIGAAGGTLDGPDGSRVVVPPAALAASATIGITRSSDGAPALPASLAAVGSMYALTPHGTAFTLPATAVLPMPAGLPAGAAVGVYKTDAAGLWQALPGVVTASDHVSVELSGFSWINIALLPPAILAQPADVSVVAPAPGSFDAVASSDARSWQWDRSDDGGTTWVALPGATAPTYRTAATSAAAAASGGDDGALFRVRITGPGGISQTRAARLSVTLGASAPTITTPPASVSAAAGQSATFSVVASGSAPLAYQWRTNGTAVPGQVSTTFTLAAVTPAQSGTTVDVVVSNAQGSVTSPPATLTVTTAAAPLPGLRFGAASVAFAVPADHSLRGWGQASAWLGDPSATTDRLVPGPVPGIASVASVAVGAQHTLAVTTGGEVWVWGYNGAGQLGDGLGGGGVQVAAPKKLTTIGGVAAVAAGAEHSVFLKSDGTVWTTGGNTVGQLGNGFFADSTTPTPVPISGVIQVSTLANHTLALKSDGTVWAWGANSACQLGNTTGPCTTQRTPVQVAGVANAFRVAAGSAHSLALVRANPADGFGSVWGWGSNLKGELRTATSTTVVAPARQIWQTPASAIGACALSSLVMHFDGTVFSFGDNGLGQLGVPSFTGSSSSAELFVSGLPAATAIFCGANRAMVQASDGELWAWGLNVYGEIGNGSRASPVRAPVRVTGINLN